MVRFLERCADTYHDQRGLVIPLVEEDSIFLRNEKNELKTPRKNCLKRAGGQDLIIGQNNNRNSSRQREFTFAPDCQFKLITDFVIPTGDEYYF